MMIAGLESSCGPGDDGGTIAAVAMMSTPDERRGGYPSSKAR